MVKGFGWIIFWKKKAKKVKASSTEPEDFKEYRQHTFFGDQVPSQTLLSNSIHV